MLHTGGSVHISTVQWTVRQIQSVVQYCIMQKKNNSKRQSFFYCVETALLQEDEREDVKMKVKVNFKLNNI